MDSAAMLQRFVQMKLIQSLAGWQLVRNVFSCYFKWICKIMFRNEIYITFDECFFVTGFCTCVIACCVTHLYFISLFSKQKFVLTFDNLGRSQDLAGFH